MITEAQRQWTRENNIRAYFGDASAPTPNGLRVASFSAPVDRDVADFGGNVEATIAAVVDATIAWQAEQ